MNIRTAYLPALAGEVTDTVCIVLDILRATSVIAVLFDRQCPRIYAAASHDAARTFARSRGFILCGETQGLRVPDFDYGNSPVEFASLDFTDKPVVISTTNGTGAMAAVSNAKHVLLGAVSNVSAVARAAWDLAVGSGLDITIVCSGTNGQYTLEDATAAGIYVESLSALAGAWTMPSLDDASVAARRLWQTEPNLLRGWMEGAHARTLAECGFGEDVAMCAAINTFSLAPILVSERMATTVRAPVILIQTEDLRESQSSASS